ncbi:MAG: hypothetical protein ABIJ16_10765, partial [Bacteroidota bacterium]
PSALFNAFLRPHFFDIHSPIVIPAFLENLALIMLAVISFIFLRKPRDNKMTSMILFSLSFVTILFVLCGLVTPVIGALVRYKIPALPFLAIIFIILADREKIKTKFLKVFRTG